MIPFNSPYLTGNELQLIQDAVDSKYIAGNGKYTKLCQMFFQEKYGFNKCLLTTSCTDALEMASILLDIKAGDEVIIPSFTFVSTANAFVLRGAKVVFVDSRSDQPNIDEDCVEELITVKTKAIVVVHYAGVACNMEKIIALAKKHRMSAVCLSDRGNLFASLEFSLEASKSGIQPICGVILNISFNYNGTPEL